ncbi:unnamed protein product [Owenia fusiformis]|uniref:C1q domain-containing protein n=1 Tax=Owenia fusiformis TaxID=6347 RepID=A0A8S4NWP3_OWEFU|nr:unnamed protein product [Owenia fusiformis]
MQKFTHLYFLNGRIQIKSQMAQFLFIVICLTGAVIGEDQDNGRAKREIYSNLNDSALEAPLIMTRKTCSVWQAEGVESDHLLVNPNGDGVPLGVFCNMSTTPATMVLEHDHMDRKTIRGPRCNSVACVRSGTIMYFSASLDRLIELIGASRSCQQYVRYECYNSGMDFTRWMTHDDRLMSHWGGSFRATVTKLKNYTMRQTITPETPNEATNITTEAPTDLTTCGCFLRRNCVNGKLCNCNNFDNRWYVDDGYLFSETTPAVAIDLPIKEVSFGSFPWSDSIGHYTIGPLTCMDKVRGCPIAPSFDNSVNDADMLGHMAGDDVNYTCSNGFISSGSLSLKCGDGGAWEKKTIICERINCGDPGNSTTTNRALDAGMIAFSATSSSGYLYSSSSSNPVPFDLASVNLGDAYSTSRGVFTAPFEGLYHVDVHLATYRSGSMYAYIVVNGRSVRTIYVEQYSGYRNRGSTSVLLQLSKGHTVNIALSSSYHVTLGQESTFSGFLLHHGNGN